MSFFGGNPPNTTAPFSFGQPQPQATSTGFTFGTNVQPQAATTGFTFGANVQTPSGYSFGGMATTTTPGFSFGGTTTTVTTTSAGTTPVLSFGQTPTFGLTQASTLQPSSAGFSLSTPSIAPFGSFKAATTIAPNTVAPSLSFGGTGGLAFGGQSTMPATSLPTFSTPASTGAIQAGSAPLGLGGFSIPATSSVGGIAGFVGAPVTTIGNAFAQTPASTFSIMSGSSATPAPLAVATTSAGLTFGSTLSVSQPPKPIPVATLTTAAPLTSTTMATTTAYTLPGQPTTTVTTTVSIGTTTTPTFAMVPPTSSTAPTTTTETTAPLVKSTTFSQLEEAINKWNVELEEQERIFLSQATQVNAWDRLLVANGEKITGLNESVERVKLEQQRLDHELDFIVAQQRELEELLIPLEKSVDASPSLSIQQHADLEREHTYHLAENVDGQLKRMSEDIKKIIEHLNTASHEDENEPMQQISKILNAHMDALQWIDHNSGLLRKKVEEVNKTLESTRKDQEKTLLKITYD